jgi:hypothetical protein
MEFVLLIQGDEDAYAALSDAEGEKMYAGHGAFMAAVKEAGVAITYSTELDHAKGGKVVRPGVGGHLVTDGPYAETKEQLGGFYVLDLPDIDAAVEWAKRIPMLPTDAVEVRPAR